MKRHNSVNLSELFSRLEFTLWDFMGHLMSLTSDSHFDAGDLRQPPAPSSTPTISYFRVPIVHVPDDWNAPCDKMFVSAVHIHRLY